MQIESYSQRLLNPFRGVQRVIRYGPAEAVSTDGWHWDLYVRNDELLRGLEHGHPILISEIRFGRWSPDHGLKRGALHPSEDFRRMERLGLRVYEALIELHEQPVFPFRDRHELWLLDWNGAPLALLDSVFDAEEIDLSPALRWLPGYAATACFASAAGADADAATDLGRYLNALADTPPRAVWLERLADGSGQTLAGVHTSAGLAQAWSAAAFPALFIAEHGHDARHRQLIADYLAWQAPCLLLLPDLSAETRARLEFQARDRAEEIARHLRLYPATVDLKMIQAARVEAMLKYAEPNTREVDEAWSTFYIELEEPDSA
jgi:hypothetical protein